MNCTNNIKKEILIHAELLLRYNDLLVEQCDSWLSEEEGMKNMEQSIRERVREQREGKWRKRMSRKKLNQNMLTC